MPILFKGDGQEKLVSFHQIKNDQNYSYNPGFVVKEVIFDPEYDILATHSANIVVNINDNKLMEQLNIFPNPASDKLFIKTDEKYIAEKISILAADGKLIYTLANENQEKLLSINISDFTPGIYYVRSLVNQHEITKQFIKN